MTLTKKHLFATLLILIGVLGASGCSFFQDEVEGQLLIGEVREITLDGGGWGIQASNDLYEVVDLPAVYREDGLRVRARVKERADLASTVMVGPIVEVITIDRIE